MVQGNTYHQPRLIIDGDEVYSNISGTVTFRGNNSLNSLSVKIDNPDLQLKAIIHKKVKLFLNNGSEDSVPFFSGYVNSLSNSDTNITLTCQDPRVLLTGKEGDLIVFDDDNNYDGFTLGAFLYSYIEDKINITETLIGTDKLSDTNPPVSLTDVREKGKVYEIAKKLIAKSIDNDSDFLNPLSYQFDIIEDSDVAQLTIKKDKQLTDLPTMTFSYSDGLLSYSYNRRLPPNTAFYEGGSFIYTNRPAGRSNIDIGSVDWAGKSRADMRRVAMKQILLENQQKDEISISVNKGYDVGIGSIIRLDVDNDDIYGNHRVVSKNVSFGKNISCKLKLNKKPIKVSDYINQ